MPPRHRTWVNKSLWREEKCSKNQKRSQGGSNKRIEEKTTVAQFSKPGKLSATTDTANVTEQDKGKRRLYILTQGDGQQVQTINASKTKQVCTQKKGSQCQARQEYCEYKIKQEV